MKHQSSDNDRRHAFVFQIKDKSKKETKAQSQLKNLEESGNDGVSDLTFASASRQAKGEVSWSRDLELSNSNTSSHRRHLEWAGPVEPPLLPWSGTAHCLTLSSQLKLQLKPHKSGLLCMFRRVQQQFFRHRVILKFCYVGFNENFMQIFLIRGNLEKLD